MSIFNEKTSMAKIAVEKSLLKEFQTSESNRVVYLNNNDEFQIQLFNPTQGVIGAEISINGTNIPGIIVLDPGQRIWLDRYTDKAVKFKFSTYEVDDNDAEVSKAIAKNGDVTVKFYREKKRKSNDYITVTYDGNHNFDKLTTPDWTYRPEQQILFNSVCDTVPVGSSNAATYAKEISCTITASDNTISSSARCCASAISDTKLNACVRSTTASDNSLSEALKNLTFGNSATEAKTAINSTITATDCKIETGRIKEGSTSNQKFTDVNTEFEWYPFETETIKILPMSRKPFTASDLQKIYCTECGRKLNPKFKFCPYCGAKCI